MDKKRCTSHIYTVYIYVRFQVPWRASFFKGRDNPVFRPVKFQQRQLFALLDFEYVPATAKKHYFQIWESGDGSNNNEEDSHILSTCETRLFLKLGKSSDR